MKLFLYNKIFYTRIAVIAGVDDPANGKSPRGSRKCCEDHFPCQVVVVGTFQEGFHANEAEGEGQYRQQPSGKHTHLQ